MMIGAKTKSSHCSVILGLAHYKDGFWQFDSPPFFFFSIFVSCKRRGEI